MTKTRAFKLISFAIGAGVALSGVSSASAGPWNPGDDRVSFSRNVGVRFVQPVVVRPVFAQPGIVQTVVPASPTVVTVPAGSDVSIRQGWAGDSVRISTPTGTSIVSGPAWASSGNSIVVASPATPAVVSPQAIVVPNNPIFVRDTVVEPLGAHDRLVVLNEFTTVNYDGRTLLYRDASGLLHERTVYGSSGIFYDHLGRRCRYDSARSQVVILDDHVVRDYNNNGVRDDDHYVDPHRRAEQQSHRDSTYRPIGTPSHATTDWRDRYRRVDNSGFRSNDDRSHDRPSTLHNDRPADTHRLTTGRPAGGAVNGRLRHDSPLTGNDRNHSSSGGKHKR